MAILKGDIPEIRARIPYVPMGPSDWFKEEGIEDMGGGPPPADPNQKPMVPTIYFKDGKLSRDGASPDALYGGKLSDKGAEDLRIVSYEGNVGGVYVEGGESDVTIEGAVISLSGDGSGLGEKSAGAGVSDHGRLTLKDVVIDVNGLSRTATSCGSFSVMKVYDSVLLSHGAPYGRGAPEGSPKMSPPAALEIEGNNRTHCTVDGSFTYFYNTIVTCDGWAALSTDMSMGYVYLEANDCKVVATKSGYGAYADWGCHDVFNRTKFDVACMAGILAGEGSMVYNDCESNCGSYMGLIHCVMGRNTEVGEFTVNGGVVRTKKAVILVKSQNAVIEFTDADILSEEGVLVHTIWNDDDKATKVKGQKVFGVEVRFSDMSANGDIIHEDHERDMRVYLDGTTLRGAIKNAILFADKGSFWYATGDSDVIVAGEIFAEQFDAPEGVTITCKAEAEKSEYALPSGGKLVIK